MKYALIFFLLISGYNSHAGVKDWWRRTCESLISSDPYYDLMDQTLDLREEAGNARHYLFLLEAEYLRMKERLESYPPLARDEREYMQLRLHHFENEIRLIDPNNRYLHRPAAE